MTRTPYTVTLICMEPSRPAVFREIVARLNAESGLPVNLLLHAHESAELVDPCRCERIARDLAASDAVIVSHVLLDEQVEALARIVRENAPDHATTVVVSSAAPLMRLTRVGRFRVGRSGEALPTEVRESDEDQEESGPSRVKSLFRRITGGRDITPYLKDLIILAPKLLRLIPGRMQDLRSYLEAYLYMVECSGENVRSMLLMLADRYHKPLAGTLRGTYAPPKVYPSEGIYHPDSPSLFASRDEYLRWYRSPGRSVVGLLLLRGEIVLGETDAIDRTIRAFEGRGIGVVAAFSGSFDYRVAVEQMMLDAEGKGIDALVSLTAFPLVGGHVRSDTARSVEALRRYGVPYFSPVPLIFQSVEEWNESEYGLNPVQTALHIALPELDGAIEPIISGGIRQLPGGNKVKTAMDDRVDLLVRRVERWVVLRDKPNAEKRIALTIFAFPPGKGSVGTAAYLDVFQSLYHTLVRMKEAGYTVELPESPEQMIEQVVSGQDRLASIATAELNVAGRLTVDEYRDRCGHVDRASGMWGEPPGVLNTDGRDIQIYGYRYGNVFVGVQPSFGFEGDPMRLLFARGATPHHGFLGYYTWISHVFGADAHLHFGTHGALEFMPGKQVGLDADSWPEIMTGELPNIYLYSINNPSEGTIAKRRSYATLVSYLTPPLENAGLYRELSTLKGMIASYRDEGTAEGRRAMTVEALIEKVDQLNLEKDVPPPSDESGYDRFVARLHGHLLEIESRLIPTGLHVVGRPPSRSELADLLLAIGEYDRPGDGVRGLAEIVASALGEERYQDLYRLAEGGVREAMEQYIQVRGIALEGIRAMLDSDGDVGRSENDGPGRGLAVIRDRLVLSRSSVTELRASLEYLARAADRAVEEGEIGALLDALEGRYIPPAIGGDPVRNPEALPSGRNIHALDPAAVPSPTAIRNARRVVDLMIAKSLEETGAYPESVGMVLWGLDNIKTQGEAIAQVFALIGVVPEADSIGRVSRLRVVALERLGRPRIDVTVQASGIFRDIFGLQIELLDQAIRLVAALDEPIEQNHVRRRALAISNDLGVPFEEACTRVFSNAAGAYGANVDYMVGMSAWEEREELAEVFTRRKSFAYGKGFASRGSRELFETLASGIDTTFQNLDSSEVGITDVDHYFEYLGGFTSVVERTRGRRPTALVADTTTARAKVRTLEATIRLEARTKLLNPKWFEGMLGHGYQGVEEIRKRLDYTFGFSATAEAVDGWVYRSVYSTYVADVEVSERMRRLNVHAYAGLVRRLTEANDRGFWDAETEERRTMDQLSEDLEDQLEGVM